MSSSGSTNSSSEEENVVGVDVASSRARKSANPKSGLFKCPSIIMKDFAKGPFNRKKPLLQYVTPRPKDKKNSRGTRVWDCHVCLDDLRGCYTRVKSHFLGVGCHGVKACPKLTDEQRL